VKDAGIEKIRVAARQELTSPREDMLSTSQADDLIRQSSIAISTRCMDLREQHVLDQLRRLSYCP